MLAACEAHCWWFPLGILISWVPHLQGPARDMQSLCISLGAVPWLSRQLEGGCDHPTLLFRTCLRLHWSSASFDSWSFAASLQALQSPMSFVPVKGSVPCVPEVKCLVLVLRFLMTPPQWIASALCSQASETSLFYILKTSTSLFCIPVIPRMLCLSSLTPSLGPILTSDTTVGGALWVLSTLRHPGILEEAWTKSLEWPGDRYRMGHCRANIDQPQEQVSAVPQRAHTHLGCPERTDRSKNPDVAMSFFRSEGVWGAPAPFCLVSFPGSLFFLKGTGQQPPFLITWTWLVLVSHFTLADPITAHW